MIEGIVTILREAVISLIVFGPQGRERIEAVVDTGFDGWLTLPPNVVTRLRLPWRSFERATLADGSESLFNVYEATVDWDGRPIPLVVDEADTTPLIGMALLEGHELNMAVRAGGSVTIKALP